MDISQIRKEFNKSNILIEEEEDVREISDSFDDLFKTVDNGWLCSQWSFGCHRGPASMGLSDNFEGFTRFMNSADNHILRRDRARVYQDMRRPISDYYISSSHNTYLLSDQLVGQSHLWAYQNALMRGCHCVEIDCWDGDNGEPIVYHGFTLTTKIPFKSVIYVIEHFAFKASQYPLVLSLEDHCCRQKQEVLANDLISILGNKLLSAPIGGD